MLPIMDTFTSIENFTQEEFVRIRLLATFTQGENRPRTADGMSLGGWGRRLYFNWLSRILLRREHVIGPYEPHRSTGQSGIWFDIVSVRPLGRNQFQALAVDTEVDFLGLRDFGFGSVNSSAW